MQGLHATMHAQLPSSYAYPGTSLQRALHRSFCHSPASISPSLLPWSPHQLTEVPMLQIADVIGCVATADEVLAAYVKEYTGMVGSEEDFALRLDAFSAPTEAKANRLAAEYSGVPPVYVKSTSAQCDEDTCIQVWSCCLLRTGGWWGWRSVVGGGWGLVVVGGWCLVAVGSGSQLVFAVGSWRRLAVGSSLHRTPRGAVLEVGSTVGAREGGHVARYLFLWGMEVQEKYNNNRGGTVGGMAVFHNGGGLCSTTGVQCPIVAVPRICSRGRLCLSGAVTILWVSLERNVSIASSLPLWGPLPWSSADGLHRQSLPIP